MPLYKQTSRGRIQMTPEEEAETRARWAKHEARLPNLLVIQARKDEYGNVEQQLEYIVEHGIEAFIARQHAIKLKHPKEGSETAPVPPMSLGAKISMIGPQLTALAGLTEDETDAALIGLQKIINLVQVGHFARALKKLNAMEAIEGVPAEKFAILKPALLEYFA